MSKFQVSSSNGLGVMIFWRYFHKGAVNESVNHGGVCITTPATPDLLKILNLLLAYIFGEATGDHYVVTVSAKGNL